MKKLIVLWFALQAFCAGAQHRISGIWEGHLNVGVPLLMDFRIQQDSGRLQVQMDVPDQGLKGMEASSAEAGADSLVIEIAKISGRYEGKRVSDSLFHGEWIQAGRRFPLDLKKVTALTIARRPQTPVPPFPYKAEDVVYANKDKSIQYGATLTIPPGKGPFPAILLITGSGQQNRDEEILQHKPFAVIADYLTRKGYLVMRVDDRGMGQTTGDVKSATSRDFANDAEVSLDYLKQRKEVDPKHIGLLGHSEGGMIAEMIAAERKDIDFIILLAAPGENIKKLMTDQNAAILSSVGMSKAYVSSYLDLYSKLLNIVPDAATVQEARQKALQVVNEWKAATAHNVVIATTGMYNDSTTNAYVNNMVYFLYLPWFRYFIHFDPAPYLEKAHSHILALNGDKDVQVVAGPNLLAMEASLKKSPAKSREIKELKGLNHLFQHCTWCTVQEYGQLEETIAPGVLETIADWLERKVGREY
jgi:uncharacterized protein